METQTPQPRPWVLVERPGRGAYYIPASGFRIEEHRVGDEPIKLTQVWR